jgi:hypothetical protein
MLSIRNLYITEVPQNNANAYKLIQSILTDNYDYVCEEDEKEDLEAFLRSERNYLCDDYKCKDVTMYNWSSYTEPARKHVVITYNEFVQKYLGLTQDQLVYEMFYQFDIKLLSDNEYSKLSQLNHKTKMYEYSLFNRYVVLASEHFDVCLTEEQCKLVQIIQDIIE